MLQLLIIGKLKSIEWLEGVISRVTVTKDDVYLSPPGGAATAAAIGAALGGYMTKEPIYLLYLTSMLLLAILILLLRHMLSKPS